MCIRLGVMIDVLVVWMCDGNSKVMCVIVVGIVVIMKICEGDYDMLMCFLLFEVILFQVKGVYLWLILFVGLLGLMLLGFIVYY